MGNHKRKKPKHQRAGCLYCKPHKDNGVNDLKHSDKKRYILDGWLQLEWYETKLNRKTGDRYKIYKTGWLRDA
jgi:hypothetical protein